MSERVGVEQTPDIEAVLRAHILAGSSIWDAECSCGEQEGVDYYTHVAQALAPVLAAAVREARAAAWDEGCKAGEHYEHEMWRHQAGALIARPERSRNPYRADRIAVDAPEGGRVHNHPPYRPVCNERRLGSGQLRGACLNDDGTDSKGGA